MRVWSAPGRLVALALAVTPWAASADENGIRVGEGRLHPYIEVESRYDTLVGYVGEADALTGATTLNPYGDLGMHYRPGCDLEVPSEAGACALAASVDIGQSRGTENEGTTEHDRVGAEADAAATFNPNGNVYFKVEDTFRRSDRTSMMVLTVGSITDFNLARVRLGIQPGSKALVIEPGYSLAFEHFEQEDGALAANCTDNDPTCDPDSVTAFDYLTHTVHLDASWKFLPKTALVFDSAYASRSYIGELKAADGSGRSVRPLEEFDADSLKLMAGVAGLVTSKLSVTLKGGWGDQLKGGVGFKSVLGLAEAGYRASEQFELKAGYLRSFESHPGPSLFYSDDRIYASARAAFGESLAVTGEVSLDTIEFGDDRSDDLVRVAVGPTYEITRWLGVSAGFAHTKRDSTVADAGLVDYNRQEFFARMRASY